MPETQIVAGREQEKYYPYTGLFYVNRHSFWEAGQDSYSLPPAQQQDMFQMLTNVEPVAQGVLQRRRGYSLFSAQGPASPFTRAYSYRNESLGTKFYIWNNPSQVVVTDEAGNNVTTNVPATPILFGPSAGAYTPRMVLSRDYGYFADGVQQDYRKWDGTAGTLNLTNWGIDVSNSTGGGGNATLAPTVAANSGSGAAWVNPNNIFVQDGNDAVQTLTSHVSAQNLNATGFGFAVPPDATISQITITGSGFLTSSGGFFPSAAAYLLRNGVPTGSRGGWIATVTIPKNTNGPFTWTWTPSNWGYSWTPADVNNANFGVALSLDSYAIVDTETFNIDNITLTVVYSLATGGGGSITVGTGGAGSITLGSGRTYFYAFQNSRTGHVSDLGPPSLSTGPLTSKNIPLSTIPTSNDPQVDTVLILATADGNDQTTLFLLTSLPNGTTTYTDNTPDALSASVVFGPALLSNAVFLETDVQGVIHGLANNKVPPVANFPVKHKGRIYMALGHTLYFSKNLDEVTTSSGTITSKWEEAWPATNAIDISEQAEAVRALMSDGETLWIATERNIRRLIGDSPQNFQKPEVQFNECGVVSPEVWKVVFYEGQPVGTMWLTPDLRVMASDFNTYHDVGTPIQDVLNSINVPFIQNAHACFVSQAAFDLFMLYLPTNGNQWPNVVAIFNLRSKKWCIWQPSDLITASLFNINGSGLPQWLFATNQGNLYFWDSTTLQDRNNAPSTGIVQSLTITNGGSGYTSFPIFANFSGGGGSGALASVIGLSAGVITQVVLTSFGSGYTSPPTVTFTGGGGTGATASTTITTVSATATYPVTIQTSWLDFGDYNIRKFVNQIIPTTADNNGLTIQVDAASNEQDFNNPLSVIPATTVIPAAIPNDVFVPLASGPSHSRAFKFTFVSPPSTIQNVLTGYAIEAGVFHRY